MTKDGDTKDRILEAARNLFHRRGYHDVGINDICREADVVKGSFYHFYPGKEALLEAVVARNAEELATGLKALNRAPLTGRARLTAQLDGVLATARRQKKHGAVLGCNLGTVASELAVCQENARRSTRRAFRVWLRSLETTIRSGIDDGSLSPALDPRATAAGLLAIIQGLSTLGRTFNDMTQLQRIADVAADRLLPPP